MVKQHAQIKVGEGGGQVIKRVLEVEAEGEREEAGGEVVQRVVEMGADTEVGDGRR